MKRLLFLLLIALLISLVACSENPTDTHTPTQAEPPTTATTVSHKADLASFEPWLRELKADQIQEVRTIQQPVAAPEHFLSSICRTSDPDAIQAILQAYAELRMTKLERKEDAIVVGGSWFTVEFILTDGTVHSLFFHNGFYTAQDETIFRVGTMPSLEPSANVTETSAFNPSREHCDVFLYDSQTAGPGACIGQFTGLAKMEFTECAQDIPQDAEFLYCIPCGWGYLLVYSDTVFCLQIKDDPPVWYTLTLGTFPEMITENG